jgi:hypothetical protein
VNATTIDYATRLWQVLQAVIICALEDMKMWLENKVAQVKRPIEQDVQSFFV